MSNHGWQCPKCDRVYSPVILECAKCNDRAAIPVPMYEPVYVPDLFVAPYHWTIPSQNPIVDPPFRVTCGSTFAASDVSIPSSTNTWVVRQ